MPSTVAWMTIRDISSPQPLARPRHLTTGLCIRLEKRVDCRLTISRHIADVQAVCIYEASGGTDILLARRTMRINEPTGNIGRGIMIG